MAVQRGLICSTPCAAYDAGSLKLILIRACVLYASMAYNSLPCPASAAAACAFLAAARWRRRPALIRSMPPLRTAAALPRSSCCCCCCCCLLSFSAFAGGAVGLRLRTARKASKPRTASANSTANALMAIVQRLWMVSINVELEFNHSSGQQVATALNCQQQRERYHITDVYFHRTLSFAGI